MTITEEGVVVGEGYYRVISGASGWLRSPPPPQLRTHSWSAPRRTREEWMNFKSASQLSPPLSSPPLCPFLSLSSLARFPLLCSPLPLTLKEISTMDLLRSGSCCQWSDLRSFCGCSFAAAVEMMASIGEFDPLNTRVPATKIEVTVSCR